MFEDKRPQSPESHSRLIPAYHGFAFLVLCLNLLLQLAWVWRAFRPFHGYKAVVLSSFGVLMAITFLILFFAMRQFPLTVQDRLIRLEMRLRLSEILPQELRVRIHELTVDQLIALRFASDAELPELVKTVLDEKITSRREIKRRIQSWQADHLRA